MIENANKRIGIIGSGMSGLSLAWYLQTKGYSDITIFEKDLRVGGKCESMKYQDRGYEFGAFIGMDSYTHVLDLMKIAGVSNDRTVIDWFFYDTHGNKIPQLTKKNANRFFVEYQKYKKIMESYQTLESPGFTNVPDELCISFNEWCAKNDLSVLKEVIVHYFSSFGTPYIDDIPALYILKVMNYKTLKSFIEITITPVITWGGCIGTFLLKLSGKLPKLKLTSNVKKIERCDDKVIVETQFEKFILDDIIITSPLNDALKFLDATEEERNLFDKIQYEAVRVYAFKVGGARLNSGIIPDNLRIEQRGHVIAWFHRKRRYPIKNDLIMVYAMENKDKSDKEMHDMVLDDLSVYKFDKLELYSYRSWHVFPHVDSEVLRNGFYEKLEAMQGKKNTYYSGEIMSSITVERCADYSEHLVNQYF